jgi:hypothetical protein
MKRESVYFGSNKIHDCDGGWNDLIFREKKMKKISVVLTAVALLFLTSCSRTLRPDAGALFDSGLETWDSGDYIQSLEGFKKILTGQESDVFFDDIALITGELYPVVKISTDGRNVRFSPDGASLVYEIIQDDRTVTHIVRSDDSTKVDREVKGRDLVFSPDGLQAVYLVLSESEEAVKAFEEARALSGRQRTSALAQAELEYSRLVLLNLVTEEETVLDTGSLLVTQPLFGSKGNTVLFTGGTKDDKTTTSLYEFNLDSRRLRRLTSGPGFAQSPALADGLTLIYRISTRNPFERTFRRSMGPAEQSELIAVLDLESGELRAFPAGSYVLDRAGSHLGYFIQSENKTEIFILALQDKSVPNKIYESPNRLADLSLSPKGNKITFSEMIDNDWEIFVLDSAGQNLKRITSEIQHDRLGRFVSENLLIGIKGESRHQRSFLYNVEDGTHFRLFHNNTLRTVAPEYEWAIHPEGKKILFVAERDGDTISPERGVFLMDMEHKISKEELLGRIETCLAAEKDLHTRGEQIFSPIQSQVRDRVSEVSERRIYEIELKMASFGSKYITEPGNAQAREYLFDLLKSFGYEPQLQWFEARDIKTANVLAVLEGTEKPDLVYVLSSHFDSNRRSPGADDNTSATAVTLEAARILRAHPQPATIIFALFTGEEAGLLGSREFVDQAVKNDMKLVGALNNDMIGWCENNRMDDTIRYSNKKIRDIQHAASFLFTDLITYDSRYIKSTDAAAYYEEFGDIVGGMGSYPILASPFYHQSTDRIETVNFHLIGEVTKSTIAALICLASNPSLWVENNSQNDSE